jgi:hypothetical protein
VEGRKREQNREKGTSRNQDKSSWMEVTCPNNQKQDAMAPHYNITIADSIRKSSHKKNICNI